MNDKSVDGHLGDAADVAPLTPEGVPDRLPDHPEELRLRKAERDLAVTIKRLARQTHDVLQSGHPRRRVDAAVLLAQLAQTCAHGQKAMVRAVQDQMDQVDHG